MTDTLGNTETEGTEGEQGQESHNMRRLREQAEKAGQLEAELETLKRERAIEKSGIDADHPMGKFFVEHYQGDITDTVALLDQAKALGVPLKGAPALDGTEQQGTEQQGTSQQAGAQGQEQSRERRILEDTGTEQRRALAGEDPNLGEVSPDPRKQALESAQEAIDKGATFEQGGGHLVAQLAQAASRGDTRVLINEVKGSDGKVRQQWQT